MLITILINKQLADNEDENEIRRHWSFSLLKSVRYKSGVGQIHVSISTAEVSQELEDAFLLLKKRKLCATKNA